MATRRRKAGRKVGREERDELMGEVFGGESQAQRVAWLRAGVDGVLPAARLGGRAMGHGLAVANGLAPRHAITQGDRLLSNPQRMRAEVARCWGRFVVAERQARFGTCDGTACEDADQAMLVLGTQTAHGRSTPLVWKTVTHSARKGQRHAPEEALRGLRTEVLPAGVRVPVGADRGFSDIQRSRFRKELGCADIMRFRRVVSGEAADGERRTARDWLGVGGRMRVRRGARVPAEGQPVPMGVCVQPQERPAPWLLASRRSALQGAAITHLDGQRFTVEETCRDVQHPRLGLKHTVMERNDRRDALCLLAVLAHTLLTLLGKASEALGLERWRGATRPRPYFHFHQGQRRFALIPTMERTRLRALLQRFGPLLREHALLSHVLGDR